MSYVEGADDDQGLQDFLTFLVTADPDGNMNIDNSTESLDPSDPVGYRAGQIDWSGDDTSTPIAHGVQQDDGSWLVSGPPGP
jgi:hypothetical protein